jgi:hypothetical protein
MKVPPSNLAGSTLPDQQLWNTYVYWSRAVFPEPLSGTVAMSRSRARIATRDQRSLQAIVFSTFALEYRLRSVYSALGLQTRWRDGLWDLASNLERRTTGVVGLNGRPVRFAAEWRRILPRIQKLLESRNSIAHGNALKVGQLITAQRPSIKVQARRGYNAFIDAIRVINLAIGYEDLLGADLRKYYAALKVRRGCEQPGR